MLVRQVIGLRLPLPIVALAGLWIGRRHLEVWMVATPLADLTAVHIAFFSGSPRFTIAMKPAAIILDALALQRVVKPA